MTLFGFDASDFDWQRGPMDLAAAVRDGISFFTHKATEGTRITHVHYRTALERARDAGMPVYGAYMVPRTPGNNGHGPIADQVAYFLDYLDAQTPWWRSDPRFRIGQVDTEKWSYDHVSPALGAQACTLIRQLAGLWTPHYAPRWAYGDTVPGSDPLWASAYGTNPATHYREAYPGDGSSIWAAYSGRTPTFVQYGSRLTIGSQPGCDANAYRGSLTDLLATINAGDDMPLTQADLDAIKTTVNGGTEALTIDELQQWLGDGVDSRSGTDVDISPRPSLKAILEKLDAVGQPTQEQVNTAVRAALADPQIQEGIAAAIASHLKVV